MSEPPPELPAGAFRKLDPGDDAEFYAPPRLVTHIDEGAVSALTGFYREVLEPGDAVLDLMSSWVSHLPDELALGEVVGHGMNAQELAANPRLTRSFVQDLNRDPQLPLADACMDAAFCCVGVQYLQRPVEVFAEVARVLRPGGVLVVSFLQPLLSQQGGGHLAGPGRRGAGPAGAALPGAGGLRRPARPRPLRRAERRSADRGDRADDAASVTS